jgi:hypothetical protein
VITTYYLFEGYCILGEVEAKEVKFLLNVQLDIEHFSRVKKIRVFYPGSWTGFTFEASFDLYDIE